MKQLPNGFARDAQRARHAVKSIASDCHAAPTQARRMRDGALQ